MPRRAFTLVELIVSMAVVALLLGLLVPALSSARAHSRTQQCQLHLRQMAVAAHNYAAMYQWFPPALRFERINGVLHEIDWDWVKPFGREEVVSPGPLWSFTNYPGEVQQCPVFMGESRAPGDPYTGYNYNTSYLAGEGFFSPPSFDAFRPGIPPHACRRAAHCAMFGDAGSKQGANKFMRAPLRSEGLAVSWQAIYSGGQAFRHRGETNIAYVDGHIGSSNQPHRGKGASQQHLSQFMDFPRNGFLSDDDSAYDPR